MCKASVAAKRSNKAIRGQHLKIGKSAHGLAAFHLKGTSVADCVTCVENGTTLTLSGIPHHLQQKHRIGAREIVTFVDTGDNKQDMIRFKSGLELPLSDFLDTQVTAYVGMLESPDHKIGGIGQHRTAGAPEHAAT